MDITDFINRLEQRRRKREEERATLQARLAEIAREHEEDMATRRHIERVLAEPDITASEKKLVLSPSDGSDAKNVVAVAHKTQRNMPAKFMVLNVVRDAPDGLAKRQIKGKIGIKYGFEINDNTLNVSLRRWANAKKVKFEDGLWHYIGIERVRPAGVLPLHQNGHLNGGMEKSESPDATPGS